MFGFGFGFETLRMVWRKPPLAFAQTIVLELQTEIQTSISDKHILTPSYS